SNKNDQWDDNTFNHDIKPAWKNYKENLENIKIDQGAKIIFEQVSFLDNYIAATKPWELIKTKDLRVEEILYNVLERLRHIALMLLPYMPETTDTILNALGLDATNEKTQSLENLTQWGKLSTETTINKQSILFPRI
ncbi:MAG: class I tRNA ligase family protein, partial [Candidatus Falkowbacteria bacterium]|nr:class I tRNA ligase family protein [Candidatus Falkowbacteria bacterium]